MSSRVDDLFLKMGIDIPFESLPTVEREHILSLLRVSDDNELTIDKIKAHIYNLKLTVEQELTEIKDAPQDWLSILVLFLPIYGIIKKWYQDQRRMQLEGRLRNYILIYNIFANKAAAHNQLDNQLRTLAVKLKEERGGGGEQ